jgi:hypothetical protein
MRSPTSCSTNIHFRSDIMNRTLTALATAATLAVTSLTIPTSADARIRGGGIAAGILGGIAAGALLGAASGGYYGYGYGPGYGYAPTYGYTPGYSYAPSYGYDYGTAYAPAYGYAPQYGYAYAPRYYGYRHHHREFQRGGER